MIDLAAMNAEIRARSRAEVADLNHDDIADALPEQLRAVATVPAEYVMIRRVSAAELTPGLKTQRVEIEILVGIVVASLAGTNAAMKGTKAIDVVAGKVMKALHWWRPAAALERLKFRGEDEAIRDGSRIAVQQRYTTSIQETYA